MTAMTTKKSDVPTTWGWQQVFASLFTPSWSLGLLLFFCLFLPSYRGCNNQVVYLSEAMLLHEITPGEIYQRFLLIWPLLFGLVTCVGTLVLVWTSDPQRASVLWWSFAGMVFLHLTLLLVACLSQISTVESESTWKWQDFSIVACWLIPTIGLPALLLVTYRYCRNWFHAAMWMQLALSLTAAACTTAVVPSLLIAKEFLIGGRLMAVGSVGLVLSTIVQLLDGYRALTRKPTESPLRLSLKAMLLLMGIGGLACAWVGACLFEA